MEKFDFEIASIQFHFAKLWNSQKGPRWKEGLLPLLKRLHLQLKDKLDSERIGFYHYPSPSNPHLASAKKIAIQIRQDFDSALCFGIGGSYLGPDALIQACSPNQSFPLHWVHNIDPASIERAENFSQGRKSAAIVISKSGNTTETLAAFYHMADRLDPKGWVFITDPKAGELRRVSELTKIETLPIPPAHLHHYHWRWACRLHMCESDWFCSLFIF